MPKVDVLIPCNDDRWLDAAIASVQAQRDANFSIFLLRTDEDQCRARNMLFSTATSDYIQYLDADDELIGTDKLARQVNLAEQHQADMVYGDVVIAHEGSPDLVMPSPPVLLAGQRIPQIGSFLFRRTSIPLPPFRHLYSDGGAVFDTVYRLLARDPRQVHDPVPAVRYRTGHKPTPPGRFQGIERAKQESRCR